MKLRIKDKEYSHGLGHHANGEIVVDLGGQFKTFETEIGVQRQDGNNAGSVVFQFTWTMKRFSTAGSFMKTIRRSPWRFRWRARRN